jgi:hypothetical protein
MKKRTALAAVMAIAMGLAIARLDTSPNWDDTGITVFLLFSASAIAGFFTIGFPWLIALAASIWIPLFNIIQSGNFASTVALIAGFAGSYTGFYLKKYFLQSDNT